MKERTLFFHVGAGKTGTSAIQWALGRNRAELAKQGFHVPVIGQVNSDHVAAHHLLSGADQFNNVDAYSLWCELAQLQNARVIVSTEYAHSNVSYGRGRQLYRRVAALMAEAGWDVKIVFYIRPQDQWIQSAYEQWLKTGALRSGETILDILNRHSPTLVSQLDLFSEIFGSHTLIVRPFEKEQLYAGDAVKDFFKFVGVGDLTQLEYPKKNSNPGMPASAINIKRLFNHVCENESQARSINRFIYDYQKLKAAGASGQSAKSRSIIPSWKRDQVRKELEGDYERIARDYLDRPDGVLFESADKGDPESDREAKGLEFTEGEIELLLFILRRLLERDSDFERRISALEAASNGVAYFFR